MSFLKGLVVSLLGLLLFFSLSIFGDMLMLKQTLLNPDFVVSQVDRLDIPSLVEELFLEQSVLEIPQEVPQGEELVAEVLSNTVADLESWMKEQASVLIYSGYDYFEGRSQSLNLVIPLEPVKDSLRDNLEQAVSQSLPPELAGASPEIIEQFINEAYQEATKDIPETFELDESLWGPEVQSILEQSRRAIGYFELGYKLLIGLIPLLILGIIFISCPVRIGLRSVGIIFLSYGALQYIGIFIITHLAGAQLTQFDLPFSAFQSWLPLFLSDLFAPLKIFSIGVAAAGVVLIIAGVVPWGQKRVAREQVLEVGQTLLCPRCGSQYAPGQRFCGACGQKLQHACPQCGAAVDTASRFCTNCGAKLG